MAKTKTKARSNSKDVLRSTNAPLVKTLPRKSIEDLVAEASDLLEQSQPELALSPITEAVTRLSTEPASHASIDTMLQLSAQGQTVYPVALVLAADVNLALGEIAKARKLYEEAARIDSDGALVSAEPWLQLAQLCEEGGKKSIEYFDKAIEIMKNEIDALEDSGSVDEELKSLVDVRRLKVSEALCGMSEVYMTDLSWEEDAEQRCEALITEAVAVCPEALSAGTLQTLANVRISQERVEEATKILQHSVLLWKDIPVEQESLARPDFPARISLARMLMEVEQEQDAMTVVESLTKEDDQSIEAWYLGGWCQLLLSQKDELAADKHQSHIEQARTWLSNCLRLYKVLGYEDTKLKDHAEELIASLDQQLGPADGEDDWEDADDDKDIDGEEVDIGSEGDSDVEMT